jgi:hypothetical protein
VIIGSFTTCYLFVNSKNKIKSLVKLHFIITKKQLLIEKWKQSWNHVHIIIISVNNYIVKCYKFTCQLEYKCNVINFDAHIISVVVIKVMNSVLTFFNLWIP